MERILGGQELRLKTESRHCPLGYKTTINTESRHGPLGYKTAITKTTINDQKTRRIPGRIGRTRIKRETQ